MQKWLKLVLIVIAIFLVLTLPIIPISKKVPYKETVVGYDCEDDPACVCDKRGGFLWLNCKQCICNRYKYETQFMPLFVVLSELD